MLTEEMDFEAELEAVQFIGQDGNFELWQSMPDSTPRKLPKSYEKKLNELIGPIKVAMEKVCDVREQNRQSKLYNHLSSLSESILALGWVMVVSYHKIAT